MQPKRKLPRRKAAQGGEMNLETASEELIDAITAEPLRPNHFVEVLSPDRTLRLFYNTSTLIRIAEDRGGFMQPPHFREPMSNLLRTRIEKIEGKKFHFESTSTFHPAYENEDLGGVLIHHRHVYFDQIMEEFYLLNPTEVYVCPVCFEHYINTRFLPQLMEEERAVHYVNEKTPVLDPLDVLSHMQGASLHSNDDEGDTTIVLDGVWDSPLVHVVFRRAADWKSHMQMHHSVTGVTAGDYRLRDVLCTYHNTYNQWHESVYQKELQTFGDSRKKKALTQQRYWRLHAGYNRLRYNRIVDAVQAAEAHPEAVSENAFPGEMIANHFNPECDDESDFINDDESGTDDDYIPHYSPQDAGFDEENEDESSTPSIKSSKEHRTRKGKRSRSPLASSISSSVTSGSDSTSSEETYATEVEKQRALFKRGLLAERDCYYVRLSAEDRHFFERSQRSNVPQSQLYDPIMHRGKIPGNSAEDEIDWENIGEALHVTTPKKIAKVTATAAVPPPSAQNPPRVQLLLDEDEAPSSNSNGIASVSLQRGTRLLLDDDA